MDKNNTGGGKEDRQPDGFNKGFLLTLEVTLALVLIFSLASVFLKHILVQREEVQVTNLAEIGEEGLAILDEYGTLKGQVYAGDFAALNDSLRFVLPAGTNFNFFIYNSSGRITNVSNGMATGATANVIYFLYGKDKYDPRRIDLVLWYQD